MSYFVGGCRIPPLFSIFSDFFMFWPETATQISSSDGFPPKTPIQHVSDGECPKIFSRSLRLLVAPHKKSKQKKTDMVWSCLVYVPILVEISSLGNNNNKQISHPRFAF